MDWTWAYECWDTLHFVRPAWAQRIFEELATTWRIITTKAENQASQFSLTERFYSSSGVKSFHSLTWLLTFGTSKFYSTLMDAPVFCKFSSHVSQICCYAAQNSTLKKLPRKRMKKYNSGSTKRLLGSGRRAKPVQRRFWPLYTLGERFSVQAQATTRECVKRAGKWTRLKRFFFWTLLTEFKEKPTKLSFPNVI